MMRKDNPNITFDELYEKVNTYITDEKELKGAHIIITDETII